MKICHISSLLLAIWELAPVHGSPLPDPRTTESKESSTTITPFVDVCPRIVPPQMATLHDRRPDVMQHFEETSKDTVRQYDKVKEDYPLKSVQGYNFAIWTGAMDCKKIMYDSGKEKPYCFAASVWNPKTNDIIEAGNAFGWVEPPPYEYRKKAVRDNLIELEGDWIAYNTMTPYNFGHFIHDWLPSIARLRANVPETTGLLMLKQDVAMNILKFLDEEFYNRVKWVELDETYHIAGNLTIQVAKYVPLENMAGCCNAMDYMRQWIAEKHPYFPEKRTVVYYSRAPRDGKSDVQHGRVVDPWLEGQIIDHITHKMSLYGRTESLVVFDGKYDNGKTMSIADQFAVFRAATTVIGPHGSGLPNLIWTDPFPRSCEERIQVLEFVPGIDSAEVQGKFTGYWTVLRKWPYDWHEILYTAASTKETTFINLPDLDNALDAMWGGESSSSNNELAQVAV